MAKVLFYKFRHFLNHWSVAFLDEKNKCTFIQDNVEELREFIKRNKDNILIGANNYTYDDILLASLLKGSNLKTEVTDEDITRLLPITLDISQGLVRNNLIDFHNMISSLWDEKGNVLPYHYANTEEDVRRELITDVEIIKGMASRDERQSFLKWKLDVIKEYNLPKEAYHYSYGNIMREILGLKIVDNPRRRNKITIDKRLEKALQDKNDPFLNELFKALQKYYSSGEHEDKYAIKIEDCLVKFNEQGIHGTIEEDYIDTNPDNDYAYLYIDFNSFGPNILINNNWLDGVAKHPEKYSEIKDRRIALKALKEPEQLYYKYMLNSGLDYLNQVYTKKGENIGLSLTISGIMTMMLLYKNISAYGTKLIECNTDGLIIRCPKKNVKKIEEVVRKIEKELQLSCDVDLVNKIVHFDTMNYVLEFADGKQKHLGSFGVFQTHPLYCSGVEAVEHALREYYLNGIPVSVTLEKTKSENNLRAFQIVKKQKKNEKPKYIKTEEGYVLYDRSSSRLFAVREDVLTNPFYVTNPKGKYEEHKTKKGRSVKDGFYHFEVSDEKLPTINDLDLDYYIAACYKVIDKHPVFKKVYIQKALSKRNCFIDLDGTLIFDKTEVQKYFTFYKAAKDIIPSEDIDIAYKLFSKQGGYLIQFLGICKKFKGYGTIENFAAFLQSKELFPGRDIRDYKQFVMNYLTYDKEASSELEAFKGSKDLLDFLRDENYNTILYSNWYKSVQRAKLDSHGFLPYFSDLCTIDDYYAKSSVKGWEDLLTAKGIKTTEENIMIGNGSSDLVPKRFNIPSIIVNHTGKVPAKAVQTNGIIINSFEEFMNPGFQKELQEGRKLSLTKKD